MRIIFRASWGPIRDLRRWVPPAPGKIPRRVSGRESCAVWDRTRKVVERASSKPPPRARDDMAEIVGMGRAERAEKVARRVVRKDLVLTTECQQG